MSFSTAISHIKRVLSKRVTSREPTRRERGVALLLVVVTTAVLGATAANFAYNSQVELEAAANSRDMLRAEYLARAGLQLGQLLTGVQAGMQNMLNSINIPGMPAGLGDTIVITDYAGFLAKALSGDSESREGLGALVGVDLKNVEGLGTPRGTSMDISISSEEGKFLINCAGGQGNNTKNQQKLYLLLYSMVRSQRYDRMFNTPDRDGIITTREDLPVSIIDWSDIDPLRYVYPGPQSGAEDRYDRGADRYDAHNSYFDTPEEMMLVRGVSEDFWGSLGEMFTVYGSSDCKVLASAVDPNSWPLIAAMIAASSSDKSAVFDPNTATVAMQVTSMLKTGLPALRAMSQTTKIPSCSADTSQCPTGFGTTRTSNTTTTTTTSTTNPSTSGTSSSSSDGVSMLSDLICSPLLSTLPAMANSLAAITGGPQVPQTQTTMHPIPMCPGMLSQYLREKGAGNSPSRRFYRIDATGIVQRNMNANKVTQTHIRGVWDTQRNVGNPLCTNHPSCFKGTWVYYRVD